MSRGLRVTGAEMVSVVGAGLVDGDVSVSKAKGLELRARDLRFEKHRR